MEYISIPCEKILALAGFAPLPVEVKISKAHALPSELAGPGSFLLYFFLNILQLLFTCSKETENNVILGYLLMTSCKRVLLK